LSKLWLTARLLRSNTISANNTVKTVLKGNDLNLVLTAIDPKVALVTIVLLVPASQEGNQVISDFSSFCIALGFWMAAEKLPSKFFLITAVVSQP
jgi:hypothetical protein